MKRPGVLARLGCVLAAAGCALEAGGGFARLEPGTLRVELEIGAARELADHSLLTDQSYRITLARCRLALRSFELQSLAAAAGGDGRFDPADPPEGYSLCHGGHCHADDGSLVPYDEVQARLAGGTPSWNAVAHVALESELDLLEPSRRTLARYEPSAELPEVTIARAVLRLDALRCEGTVERDTLPEPLALEVDLPLSAAELRVPLDVPISRDGPETLAPEVRLRIDGTLFDRIDFAALADGGRVGLGGDHFEAIESFTGAAALTVQLGTGKD